MLPVKRFLWLLLLQSVLAALSPGQTPKSAVSSSVEPPAPRCTVKGRVVYDDNNHPVRRSNVTLTQLPDRGEFSSATDRDGRFEIHGVPAGVYFVVVDSPGLITPYAFMKFSEGVPAESLDLKELKEYCTQIAVDGTNNIDITVRARRGGAISGKVTYSDGAIAVNAVLAVLRKKGNQVTRVLTGANVGAMLSFHTDDRGRYRISGLPPGDYLVSASEKNTDPRANSRSDPFSELFKNDALAVSFYGNGTRLTDAVTLKVDLGSELSNIDIVLSDATPHTISGSVIAKTGGRAVGGARLSIRNQEQGDWFTQGQQETVTDSEGRWIFSRVPDGTYTVVVEAPFDSASPPAAGDDKDDKPASAPTRKFLSREAEINVTGSDLSGVAIELVEGASISGTVEFPPQAERDGYVMVYAASEGENRARDSSVSAFNGTFVLEPVRPGKIYLTAESNFIDSRDARLQKYYVKSITLNGMDLLHKPLTVESGQSVSNVRIVLSSDLGRAKVQLVDGGGKPLTARKLLMVSSDPANWAFSSRLIPDVTDAMGTVLFSGAPGDYLVIVLGPDEAWPSSADAVRSHSETARHITLQPGDNKTITVALDR